MKKNKVILNSFKPFQILPYMPQGRIGIPSVMMIRN